MTLTDRPIVAPRRHTRRAMFDADTPTERTFDPIPLADLKVLGLVGSDTYAKHGDGELRIRQSHYYPPGATDADELVLELLPGDDSGNRTLRQVGVGRVPPQPLKVLHEGYFVAKGTYAEAAAAWELRRNPPPPPDLPLRLGPPLSEVKATLKEQGVSLSVRDGRLLARSARGRVLDSALALIEQYREPLTDERSPCIGCGKAPGTRCDALGNPWCEACATKEAKR